MKLSIKIEIGSFPFFFKVQIQTNIKEKIAKVVRAGKQNIQSSFTSLDIS